jgi:hypothetical protein
LGGSGSGGKYCHRNKKAVKSQGATGGKSYHFLHCEASFAWRDHTGFEFQIAGQFGVRQSAEFARQLQRQGQPAVSVVILKIFSRFFFAFSTLMIAATETETK